MDRFLSPEEVPTSHELAVQQALINHTGLPLSSLRFRHVRLPLSELEYHISTPEAYLQDGDEAGYGLVMDFADAYARAEQVPPIICKLEPDGLYELIDGYHRLAGAAAAECEQIEVLLAEKLE